MRCASEARTGAEARLFAMRFRGALKGAAPLTKVRGFHLTMRGFHPDHPFHLTPDDPRRSPLQKAGATWAKPGWRDELAAMKAKSGSLATRHSPLATEVQ